MPRLSLSTHSLSLSLRLVRKKKITERLFVFSISSSSRFSLMTSDSGLSAISRLLMAGYRLTSDGCPGCGGPMMQEAPPQRSSLSTSTASTTLIDAPSSSSSSSRLVCARCDAGQLRSVLNQASTMARSNGVHRYGDEGEGDSASDEDDDDGICGVDAAFSRLATASAAAHQPARPPRRANPPAPSAAPTATATASDPDLPGADREPSAAMGDLLLKGWTMLGEACPACGGTTPLMRKRGGGVNGGETYCVKCRAWVRYQEEGEEEGEEEFEEEEEEAAAPAAPARARPAAAAAAAAPPAGRPAAVASAASASASVSEAEDSALVDARQALVEALRDATQALRRQQRRGAAAGGAGGAGGGGTREEESGSSHETSINDNSCRASAARLVGECARALAAVRAALGA